MNLQFRPASDDDIEDIVRLSLLAWAPVFDSFEQILGSEIYTTIYPDWRRQQRETVERVFRDRDKFIVWLAELDGTIAGFIVYFLDIQERVGEVDLLAVHPKYQNLGIAEELNNLVLEKMKKSGMKLAVVGTGGDPGHAPARRSYEKAGYTALPLVRYYKVL